MKPGQKSFEGGTILAFGAHPDDIEFGCGAVIAKETRGGGKAHFVVCSRGESASNGTPEVRTKEAEKSAGILGATLEFVELDGDAHLEIKAEHAIRLARIIRIVKPAFVLAPTLVEDQHPDHAKLGQLVGDAARLARYGGVKELLEHPPHAIGQLFYYAITPNAEPKDLTPILVDVSGTEVITAWIEAMKAHESQGLTRDYAGLAYGRAQVAGITAGVEHAIALYPSDPIVVHYLGEVGRGARRF